jgi:thiamine-monophosphate kinase
VVNLSDIFAMNARPTQILVSIGVSSKFKVEDLDELYSGMKLACLNYGVDLVGGDTSSSLTGLTISITAIGEAEKEQIIYRNTAKKNDLICVSGDLGAAYMGLQLLERERAVFENTDGAVPSLEPHSYIIGRQLKPEAKADILESLKINGIHPSAMIDVSDGLSSDLLHIARTSGLGCFIYSDRIPISAETQSMAEELGIDPLTSALNGGEDYELLFTLPLDFAEKIKQIPEISLIGHMVDKDKGEKLITPDQSAIDLVAQGWQHQ